VRQFCDERNLTLNEINLERHLDLDEVFSTLDMDMIKAELEGILGRPLGTPKSILFLDEIQSTPSAIQALRYFLEDTPEIPVIAAGSLLEFALSKHTFSMPVGRIEYHHLSPMTFREFLDAIDPALCAYLDDLVADSNLPTSAHKRLAARQRQYLCVGGLPEAVLTFAETGSMEEVKRVHRSILNTYEDDFSKYATQDRLSLLQRVFRLIPRFVSQKVKYVNYSREARSRDVKAAIDMLAKAGVSCPVFASRASGVPLHAEVNERSFKLLFLDVGLMNHACGVDWLALSRMDEIRLINEGSVAEQFVGQHLAYVDGGDEPPRPVYWLCEGRGGSAEVDYVVSRGPDIFPVEVKAGTSGKLRSLHQFANKKDLRCAIRFDLNPRSRQRISHPVPSRHGTETVEMDLINLPLYAASELGPILDQLRDYTID